MVKQAQRQNLHDSSTYRPERWMVDEENGVTVDSVTLLTYIKSCFHPFSAGPGNCAGQNLVVLKTLVVARTLYRTDVRLAPGSMPGAGTPEPGWGRRDKCQLQLDDNFVAIRLESMLQFRKR